MIIKSIKGWFGRPTPAAVVAERTSHHTRELIEAQRQLEQAKANVSYHQNTLRTLQQTQLELEKAN